MQNKKILNVVDSTGQYMYVDSTDTKGFQEVAKLVSPMTTAPMSGCLSFQYQKHHSGDHLFTLFTRDQAGQYQELWRADLPENNHVDWNPEDRVWIPVQVDLKAPYPIEVHRRHVYQWCRIQIFKVKVHMYCSHEIF